MTAHRLLELGRAERDTIRMNIRTLESRADVSAKVEISASMARVIAGQLRRLLEENR